LIIHNRYQSILVVEELIALESQLVVTKVMHCGDLIHAGDRPSQQGAKGT
jgi:hypothetical protein